MEEILASIRRIIADGERDAQEAGGPRDRSEPAATAPSEPAVAVSHAEVLVLTEMVQEDGSVVSLQSAVASVPAQSEEGSGERLFRVDLPAEEAPRPPASAVVNPPPETAATVIKPAPRPTSPAAAAAPQPVATAPVDAGLAAASERLAAMLQSTPPPKREERIPVSSEGLKKPELVSEEALAASTAALAQLAQSVTRTREPAPGASKTLEELVREAVEPLLKQWLDQHLPRIVERMVREAIDRVVRRVE